MSDIGAVSARAAVNLPVPAEPPATAGRVSAQMTFSDFGAPVSVTAPPASEVFLPANVQFGVSPGPQ